MSKIYQPEDFTHAAIFDDPKTFAGWPANHGAWQWGEELLVGFMIGDFNTHVHFHDIAQPYTKLQARSLDGGVTWDVEAPGVDFSGKSPTPAPTIVDPAKDIIRVCGVYDTGGDDCDPAGAYYVSATRGKSWAGPYSFDLPTAHLANKIGDFTGRTCVLPSGLTFLSANLGPWGTDFVFCAQATAQGFKLRSIVLKDSERAVMPAAAQVGERIVVAMRRPRRVDVVTSDDGGFYWSDPVTIGATGRSNGNPPALIAVGDTLYCAYANRSEQVVQISRSTDLGRSWQPWAIVNRGARTDIGYPRLFVANGSLVCIYYWAPTNNVAAKIVASRITLGDQ